MCHSIGQMSNINKLMHSKKCTMFYNFSYGTSSMKKHIVNEHVVFVLVWYKEQKKVTNEVGGNSEKRKKRNTLAPTSYNQC